MVLTDCAQHSKRPVSNRECDNQANAVRSTASSAERKAGGEASAGCQDRLAVKLASVKQELSVKGTYRWL